MNTAQLPKPFPLRLQLWRLLTFSECFGQALGEALIEARLPGSMGDPETVRILERAQAEEAALANFIRCQLYPEGGQ